MKRWHKQTGQFLDQSHSLILEQDKAQALARQEKLTRLFIHKSPPEVIEAHRSLRRAYADRLAR